MSKWKTLSSKLAFDNPWFKVQQDIVELPNGKVIDDYLMWKEGDVVFAFPVTTDKKIILVKQYKHAAGKEVIEFPAGYINKTESPEEAVKRELLEETGYSYKKLSKLFESYNNPTKIIGTYHYYLAEDCVISPDTMYEADETEDIKALLKTPEEVLRMLQNNEINVTSSIAAGFMGLAKIGVITL